ncbi:hypothetical protein MANY_07850 [Mycolicibacterium anyangense]|jgi:hypothetical protein|uniref:Uncharacterized protein n=1 Tax=Mycolicibacterium anyangense TaxID=1431246 RepID=A0A6N4W4G6_9MYCO|nr:hypothetical protein [Mycolicibacterium anyangense]BBZ75448.1 hypothetical protein MANY_07850 [Mycolicibacterium anyangense]
MKATRMTGVVIGGAAIALMGVVSVVDSAAPPRGNVVAGNGPYVVFPTPSPSAVAVVSTATTTTEAPASPGH